MLTNEVMLAAIQDSEEKARSGRAGGLAKAARLAGATGTRHTEQIQIRPEKNRTESARSVSFSDLFLTWWGIYPKQVRQSEANRAFVETITSLEIQAELMVGTERWISSAQWRDSDGGRYIPDPARFIREERWREHPPQAIDLDDPFEAAKRLLESQERD